MESIVLLYGSTIFKAVARASRKIFRAGFEKPTSDERVKNEKNFRIPKDSNTIGMRGSPFETIPSKVVGLARYSGGVRWMDCATGYLQFRGSLLLKSEPRNGRTSGWRM